MLELVQCLMQIELKHCPHTLIALPLLDFIQWGALDIDIKAVPLLRLYIWFKSKGGWNGK